MKRLFCILISILVALTGLAQTGWEAPAAEDYESRTIVIYQLRIDGEFVTSDRNVTVAAFIGDECRGVSVAGDVDYEPDGGATITYSQLDVYGGADDRGLPITFRMMCGETPYTLNTDILYDEEVHGTLSALEQFGVIDFFGDGLNVVLDDIRLDVNERPRSENLYDLVRLQYYDRSLGTQAEISLGDLPATPEGFRIDWSSFTWLSHFDFVQPGAGEAYLVATSGTMRDGEWIGGSIQWGDYGYLWFSAMAYATPIDRLDYNVRMRVADIHTQTGESIDLGDYITLRIPVYADDDVAALEEDYDDYDPDYGPDGPIGFDEVTYNDLATYLGHEVNLHLSLAVPEGYFYPNDPDSEHPNVYVARYPTTAEGLEFWVWGGGTGLQLSCEDPGWLYIEPFDVLDANTSIVMRQDVIIDLESTPGTDLRDYMEVCYTDPETGDETYTPFHDFFDHFVEEHGYDPGLTFEWEDNAHYSISGRDRCTLVPTTRSYSEGLPLRGRVSNAVGWGWEFDNRVYITPFERFDDYARIHLDDLYIERGSSVDIRDYITFEFLDSEGYYEAVPFRTLADDLGYTPDLTFHWYFKNNGYYTIGDDDYTITAVRSTTVSGMPLSFYLDYRGFDNRTYAQSGTVYITPYDNFSEYVEVTLDDIELEYGTPADIRDYITFHIPMSDDSGTIDVAFRDLEATLGSAPDFQVLVDTWTDVYSLDGFTLRGNQPADYEPISIRLEAFDSDYVYYADAYVTVTIPDDYTPMERFAITLPSGTGRYTTVSAPITLTPAGANFEITRFTAELASPSTWENAEWEAAEVTFDVRDGRPYIHITPLVAGAIALNIRYDDSYYLPPFWSCRYSTEVALSGWADQVIGEGWDWYTFYGLDHDLTLSTLDTALFGGSIEDIRTQDAADYKDPVYGFSGYIDALSAHDCVKVKNGGAATTYYYRTADGPASLHAPTQVEIDPGWNWIAYPYQYPRSLRSLTAYLPHGEGDRLISRTSGFSESDGEGWTGSLSTLNPGEGFIYYNASDEPVRFTYPPEIQLPQPADVHALAHPEGPADVAVFGGWRKAAARSPHNMCIVAAIDGYHYDETLAGDDAPLTIRAYVGQECRGEGHLMTSDDGSRQWFFISLYGQPGEYVTLYVCDPADPSLADPALADDADQLPPPENRLHAAPLTFQQSAGTLAHPVMLTLPTGITRLQAPTTDGEWYDLSGRRIGRRTASTVRIRKNEKSIIHE